MIIGIPKELKQGEARVAITPEGAMSLSSSGHVVLIQTGAGELSGYSDEDYHSSGAEIVQSLADVWKGCELLVKVKEPAPEEIPFFRAGLNVFSFLHPAAHPELTKAMVESGVTGLDYDLVTLDDGKLPILEPMSVIAGKLAVQCGATALQAGAGGSGVLLGGTETVPPAKVVIIGGGNAGKNAALVARGMGADTVILDIDTEKLSRFSKNNPSIKILYSSPETIIKEISHCNLLIGAVLIPGAKAPKIITKEALLTMPAGSVMVDICIDQGGFSETSRPTTISEPTYIESGVVHSCVANMPALVPRTSTKALTNETLPWIKILANQGIQSALKDSVALRHSVTMFGGKLTNEVIGQALGMESLSEEEVTSLIG